MLKIKNYKLIFPIFAFILLLGGFFVYSNKVEEIELHATRYSFKDFEELESKADLIVIAEPTGKRENVVTGEEFNIDGHTLTEIKIKDVLKSTRNDVKKGDKINIIEPYWIQDSAFKFGKIKVTYEGYTELQDKSLYLLTLSYFDEGSAYATYGLDQSKYNLDGKDKKEEERRSESKHLKALMDQAGDKYKDKLKEHIN